MFGKRLYKTTMVNVFRLMVLAVVVFFFNDFYLQTITDARFHQLLAVPYESLLSRLMAFAHYHYLYPADLISFVVFIITPAFYYAFIRGVRFHEKALIFNRGLPFMDHVIPYEDIKTYKLLHPKLAISIQTKGGDAFVIADNEVERVIAILDQHNIPGDLASEAYVRMISNYKKLLVVLVLATVVIFVVRKLGLLFF